MARRKYKVIYRLRVENMVYNFDDKEWQVSAIVRNKLCKSLWKLGLYDRKYGDHYDIYTSFRSFKGKNAFKRAKGAASTLLQNKSLDNDLVYDFTDVIVERQCWKNGRREHWDFWWPEVK
jgi:hypothetical protein